MQDLPSHRTTIGTLCRFLNANCHHYIMYLASESCPTTAKDFGEQLYAYLSRHAEVRLKNDLQVGDRLLWQLLYDLIEDAPEMVWSTLATYYLEVFQQTESPESGNWMCLDPLANAGY